MFQELIDFAQSPGFVEEGIVRIVSARRSDDDADLELHIEFQIPGAPIESWEVLCTDERDSLITLDWDDPFELTDDHAVLWPHTEARLSLWISQAGPDSKASIGSLRQAHFDKVGDWIPFSEFFNPSVELFSLLSGGHGNVANGPAPLLLAYEAVLQEQGFTVSVTGTSPNPRMKTSPLRALIMGRSYVVASSFKAQRIPARAGQVLRDLT